MTAWSGWGHLLLLAPLALADRQAGALGTCSTALVLLPKEGGAGEPAPPKGPETELHPAPAGLRGGVCLLLPWQWHGAAGSKEQTNKFSHRMSQPPPGSLSWDSPFSMGVYCTSITSLTGWPTWDELASPGNSSGQQLPALDSLQARHSLPVGHSLSLHLHRAGSQELI